MKARFVFESALTPSVLQKDLVLASFPPMLRRKCVGGGLLSSRVSRLTKKLLCRRSMAFFVRDAFVALLVRAPVSARWEVVAC